MRTVKFKNNKFRLKEKIIISLTLNVLLSTFMTYQISNKMTDKILDAADKMIKKDNNLKIKEAIAKANIPNEEGLKLIEVIKNSKEEIVEVDFNINECKKIMQSIIHYMNISTKGFNEKGYKMYIPLGYLSDSPLLLNLGPKIPINAKTTDVAMGNVKTTIKEYGINNALVEIYIEILLKVDTILPLEKREQDVTYETLVASKIITGSVPNFYNGTFTKESARINLPIDE